MKKTRMLYKLLNYPGTLFKRLNNSLKVKMLKKCGKGVRLGKNVEATWENCSIGDDVYIGDNAVFMCAIAPLEIGDHVIFGPNCTVITGDHRIDIVGKYMSEVKGEDKSPENALPVKFEGDNWIGANATILKGVTIGFGAVIAAGAVVVQNVSPYSIVGGVPAKLISMRFKDAEMNEHEKQLKLSNHDKG